MSMSMLSLEDVEPGHHQFSFDTASMKERLRQNMTMKVDYDVSNFYKTSGFCQMVARSVIFDNVTLAVIAVNALWISVDTDNNDASMLLDAAPIFQVAEHFFCAYFSFEWCIRFGAFEHKRNTLRDAWFVFDSFMVTMMVLETWVTTLILLALGGSSSSIGLGDASILRLLRLMRLSRMARMAKILRTMPELLILIKGMIAAMRSVLCAFALLAILVYIFAVAFRQLTDGSLAGLQYFPTVLEAMHTLLLHGTLMVNVGSVVVALREESMAYVVTFYVYICMGALMLMNMLIGVLCEVVNVVAVTEREQIAVSTLRDGFLEIIERGGLDTDGDSMISQKEFELILLNTDAVRLLERVKVDAYDLVDLADFLFTPKDEEIEDKETQSTVGKHLTFGQFMEVVLSLRGDNNATVKDIVNMRKFIRDSVSTLEERVRSLSRPQRQMSGKSSTSSRRRAFSNRGKRRSSTRSDVEEDRLHLDDKRLHVRPPSPNALPETKFAAGCGCSLRPLPPQSAPPSWDALPVPKTLLAGHKKARLPCTKERRSRPRLLKELRERALRLEGVLACAGGEVAKFVEGVPASEELGQLRKLHSRLGRLERALKAGLDELQSVQRMA